MRRTLGSLARLMESGTTRRVMERIKANVFGQVQGVSFRYYTRREAQRLGLTGWIRNEIDGSVKVVAEGDHGQLESLLAFLQTGPPGATVELVKPEWSASPREFDSFEIRWI